MELKVFELVVDPNDESGVTAIALVDEPAIERDFLKFNKQNLFKFKIDNEEKRIVSGYAMLADLPIIRFDEERGEHYVKFSKETINLIVDKFTRNGLNSSVNLMHDPNLMVGDKVHIFESFILDEDRGILAPKGYGDAPEGSWFVSMKVNDEELWRAVKDDQFKGFSVEGAFSHGEVEIKEEDLIEDIIESIQKFDTQRGIQYNYLKEFNKMNKEEKTNIIDKVRGFFKSEEVEAETVENTENVETNEEVKEEKFIDTQLEDGTVVSIEPALEIGAAVAIAGAGEPAPDGEHRLADGVIIVVEGGAINDILREVEEEEVEQSNEAPAQEEMNDVEGTPKVVTETVSIEKKFQEELDKAIENVTKELTEKFEAQLAEKDARFDEFAAITADALEALSKKPSEETSTNRKPNRFKKKTETPEEKASKIANFRKAKNK